MSTRRWLRTRVAALALGLAVTGASALASAQTATLRRDFGGPLGYGENFLPPADDDSSTGIPLFPSFSMGIVLNGQSFDSAFVNNNGNISFGSPLTDFTPRAFPGASVPMIAAWWADVDTRLIDPDAGVGADGVYWHVGPGVLEATWFNVGYFDRHRDLLNSFQMIITESGATGAPGDIDIELRYNRCEWTTGDASMGVPAGAGYDFTSVPGGSSMAFDVLPGSLTPAVPLLCTESNVGSPGIWQLHVRTGRVSFCGDGVVDPGEECDPAIPPFGACTTDCHMCPTGMCGGTDAGFPPDVPGDVPTDTPTDVPVDVPVDVPTDVPTDMGVDAAVDAAMDVPVGRDVVTDVPTDVPMDVGVDAVADVAPDVVPEAGTDAGTDAVAEAGVDVITPDVPTDVAVDAGVDARADAAVDSPADVPVDSPTDTLLADAGMDAGLDAGMDSSAAPDVAGGVVENYGGGGVFRCAAGRSTGGGSSRGERAALVVGALGLGLALSRRRGRRQRRHDGSRDKR